MDKKLVEKGSTFFKVVGVLSILSGIYFVILFPLGLFLGGQGSGPSYMGIIILLSILFGVLGIVSGISTFFNKKWAYYNSLAVVIVTVILMCYNFINAMAIRSAALKSGVFG